MLFHYAYIVAGAQRSSTQKTVLNYKNLPDDQAVSKTPSRIKTNKLKSYNRKSRKKFAQNAKFPLSEAELAHDVQSYFSGDLEAMFVDSTYGVNKEICDDEITQDLNKHPALVLNADYQVCLIFAGHILFCNVCHSNHVSAIANAPIERMVVAKCSKGGSGW